MSEDIGLDSVPGPVFELLLLTTWCLFGRSQRETTVKFTFGIY